MAWYVDTDQILYIYLLTQCNLFINLLRKSMVEICVSIIHWLKDRIHLPLESIWEIDHDTVIPILIAVHPHSRLHVIEEEVLRVLEVVVGQEIEEDLEVVVFQEEEDRIAVPKDLEATLVELVVSVNDLILKLKFNCI